MTDKEEKVLSPEIKFQLVRKLERHKIIGLVGKELKPHEAKYLEFHRLSGVILFERNLESLPQMADLIGSVEERLSSDGLVPLVMADHEGDFVSELRNLIGVPPSAMAIAATGDPKLAHDVAYETGLAMTKLGVNVVLAPVADCYMDPSSPITGLRAFGRDPSKVAEFVGETIRGFHKAGVLTCAKHFPGHGATSNDSHDTLPEITKTLDELRVSELIPFKGAIDAGVDMVMTAHIAFSFDEKTDDGTPASFDPRLIRGVLREQLGFDGVVITDALEMEGARQHARARYGGLTGGFERTVIAGSDLMLYSSPVPEKMNMQDESEPMIAVEVMQTIIETLSRVVDRSRIDSKLEEAAKHHEGVRNFLTILDQSERRIAELRERAAELRSPPTPKMEGNVIHLENYASAPAIYKAAAEKSVVLVRDPDSFIPVGDKQEWWLLPVEYHRGESLKRQDVQNFLKALCRRFTIWNITGTVTGFDPDATGRLQPRFAAKTGRIGARPTRSEPARLAEDAAIVPVLSTRGTPPDTLLNQLSEFVEQRQAPFVLVTGWPLIDWVPESVGCLVTFGASAPVAAAVAAVLAGEVEATGSLQGLL
jgi:beta-glucosidase-like glycosyl hydrolase